MGTLRERTYIGPLSMIVTCLLSQLCPRSRQAVELQLGKAGSTQARENRVYQKPTGTSASGKKGSGTNNKPQQTNEVAADLNRNEENMREDEEGLAEAGLPKFDWHSWLCQERNALLLREQCQQFGRTAGDRRKHKSSAFAAPQRGGSGNSNKGQKTNGFAGSSTWWRQTT